MQGGFIRLTPVELSRCDESSSFLQSGFWGGFKAGFGWNARAFKVDFASGQTISLLVLRRRLGPFISFAYVPWGPEFPLSILESTTPIESILRELSVELVKNLPSDTVFIRYDLPWYSSENKTVHRNFSHPFVRPGITVQVPDSVVLDLTKTEEELLQSMKAKWRYNIRLAEKKGVTVRRLDAEALSDFYRMYEQTAKRDAIAIHPFSYYSKLFHAVRLNYSNAPDIRLYLAEFENEPLAGIISVFYKQEAIYLYGASSNIKRHLMPAYALQWRAICDAKAASCKTYDFFGIPPENDSSHPMHGLYQFKTGFGGTLIHRQGCLDYPANTFMYTLFRAAEKVRQFSRFLKKRVG